MSQTENAVTSSSGAKEVGVVFCHADNNLIARLQTRTRIALCHHVDGFSGAARPDDSFIIRCIQ